MVVIMTRCYTVLLTTLFLLPTIVSCSVDVEVGIKSFLYEGQKHCDNVFGRWRCDSYFVVCISTRNQSCSSNIVSTSTARNKNNLTDLLHNKQISPDPISFKIDSFQEAPFMVRIQVINNNPIHDKLIDVVTWVYNGTTTFNESGVQIDGENGKARLTLSFLIKCEADYYGPACDRYCTADHHSRCDQNGIKQCLLGFTGNVCNISVGSAVGTSHGKTNPTGVYQYNAHYTRTNLRRNPRSVATGPRSATILNTMLVQSTFQTAKVSAYSDSTIPRTTIPPVSKLHTVSPNPRNTAEKFDQTVSATSNTFVIDVSTKRTPGFQTTSESTQTIYLSSKRTNGHTARDKQFTRPATSFPSTPNGKGAKLVSSTILPQMSSTQPSELSLNTSSKTDTSQLPTSDTFASYLPTKQQNTEAPMKMPTKSSLPEISTSILRDSTRDFTTSSLKSSTVGADVSTQQLRTSKVVYNKTVIPPTNESAINTSIPISGKSAGFEHERSGQNGEPRRTQSWIMPLAISLTLVAVTMAIVAAVIFNYFKKKQRLVPYIEMLDNDTEVEIFSGGSLRFQLESQTVDQSQTQYEELPGEMLNNNSLPN